MVHQQQRPDMAAGADRRRIQPSEGGRQLLELARRLQQNRWSRSTPEWSYLCSWRRCGVLRAPKVNATTWWGSARQARTARPVGPSSIPNQASLLQTAIDSNVDGIAVTLGKPGAMAGGVQEGVAAALVDSRPLLLERA